MQSDTFGKLRSKFLRINIPISFWREVKTLPFLKICLLSLLAVFSSTFIHISPTSPYKLKLLTKCHHVSNPKNSLHHLSNQEFCNGPKSEWPNCVISINHFISPFNCTFSVYLKMLSPWSSLVDLACKIKLHVILLSKFLFNTSAKVDITIKITVKYSLTSASFLYKQ